MLATVSGHCRGAQGSWGHLVSSIDLGEGPEPAEQEGLRRLLTMALLSGASLLPCLISEPLSQPEDMLDRLQLRQGSLQTGFCGARNAKQILTFVIL